MKIVWIISFFLLIQCSGPNNKLVFWSDTKDFIWIDYQANQSIEKNQFQFIPNVLFVHAKFLDYPFLEWILPYYEVYTPTLSLQKNAIKWGACLADMNYLAIYQKNIGLNKYRNYADSLKMNIFNGYELPEFYNSFSENPDSVLIWVAGQLGSLDLICRTLEKNQEIKHLVYFGAWLETLYIVSHAASFKEDVSLFLKLEEHQNYVEFYQQFLKKQNFSDWITYDVDKIYHQLKVTQTVNVWDSIENQFHLKTFPLKEPVINLQKNLSELRKKWIIEN